MSFQVHIHSTKNEEPLNMVRSKNYEPMIRMVFNMYRFFSSLIMLLIKLKTFQWPLQWLEGLLYKKMTKIFIGGITVPYHWLSSMDRFMIYYIQSYLFNMTRLGNKKMVVLSRCHNNEVTSMYQCLELGQHSNAHISVNTHLKWATQPRKEAHSK